MNAQYLILIFHPTIGISVCGTIRGPLIDGKSKCLPPNYFGLPKASFDICPGIFISEIPLVSQQRFALGNRFLMAKSGITAGNVKLEGGIQVEETSSQF